MREKVGLSNSALKIIAILSMLTDHIAAVLLKPATKGSEQIASLYRLMRTGIGRMAFPIFCFLLVEGFQKTRHRKKYALRLFLFALLSEIPYNLAFYGTPVYLKSCNIFYTLLLALLMLQLLEKAEMHVRKLWLLLPIQAVICLAAAAAANGIRCDYGAKGILAVALLYFFRRNKGEQLTAGCVAFVWEYTALLAFIPISFYNGKRGWKLKYVFYCFYPVHLLLLYACKCLIWQK